MTEDELVRYVQAQHGRQRNAYEDRWRVLDIHDIEMPDFNDLSPKEQASVCEHCGDFLDPEMPVREGEPILCGGDHCLDEENNPARYGG